MRKYWCGVASKEHVQIGYNEGFCQLCHGKNYPLERMNVGDWIIYYSPVYKYKSDEKFQKFTAIGEIVGKNVYSFEMFPGFTPYRRDVKYYSCSNVSIHDLLNDLDFTKGILKWGYKFRYGHFELSEHDFKLISYNMLGINILNEE
ncbi:EVE domain-containing protein [Apibacter sp. B2966]|uniref:EVE domain-containing protein n=1 Tax=Apibacter sp. B2966 TaxID=2656761 RepID=UPI00140A8DE1|nr:EVE domain-containing protein [Apibacter sp. B2966]QII72322.1 EVE domain-containing protein [Apibacter sp. B2966]